MISYELVLKGGRVIDPSRKIDRLADVALASGRIAAVDDDIPVSLAKRFVHVEGNLVVPGLVDLHAHVNDGTSLGVNADQHCLMKGTTTVLDAGSAGAHNFAGFRRFIIKPSKARIRSLLNISSIGAPFGGIAELQWLRLVDVDAAVKTIKANRDLVVGIKVRMSKSVVGENGITPLLLALKAADATQLPIMVHIGDSPVTLGEILNLLRSGDIVTHIYTAFGGLEYVGDGGDWQKLPFRAKGSGTTILDSSGRVIPEAWEARDRGVIMDVGHGNGSFSFEVCSAAIEQGFKPDTLGTDLHQHCIDGPVYDLPTLMSRFLILGMTLPEIVFASTFRPAQVMGYSGEIGTLQPGACGDVTVLQLQQGHFEFEDAGGETLSGDQKLVPVLTVRASEIVDAGNINNESK